MNSKVKKLITIRQSDLKLIMEFLNQNIDSFAEFLEEKEIEPTEAEIIIDSVGQINAVLEHVKHMAEKVAA